MAIDLTLKSTAISNREAEPQVANNPGNGGAGNIKNVFSLLASLPASLTATSIIRLVEVPSNARVIAVKLYNGAQTAGIADFGVYRNNRDGGAVVDADLFGTVVSLATAVNGTDITDESGSFDPATRVKPLWEAAGLSADPGGTLDIAATITTNVTTGLGVLAVDVSYVV